MNQVEELTQQVKDLAAQVAEFHAWRKEREEKELRARLITPDMAAAATGRKETDLVELSNNGVITRYRIGKHRNQYYDLEQLASVFGAGVIPRLQSFTRKGVIGAGPIGPIGTCC